MTKRLQLIEDFGQRLYGPRWQNGLARGAGLSSALMSNIMSGAKPATDATLNRLLEFGKRFRIDLVRQYDHVQRSMSAISIELGEGQTVEIGDTGADWEAGRYEAEMDRRVQTQVDDVLAPIDEAISRVLDYPSANNLQALAELRGLPFDAAPSPRI